MKGKKKDIFNVQNNYGFKNLLHNFEREIYSDPDINHFIIHF